MLIEFKVENFRSIKEEQTLSMIASNADKKLVENYFEIDFLPKNDNKLLKTNAIYGANASGKSNLLKALECLQEIVVNSHNYQFNEKLKVTPFKLDSIWENKPTKFEIEFIYNQTRYLYGIKLNTENIIEECLYYWEKMTKRTQKHIVFERRNTNEFIFSNMKGIDNKLYEITRRSTNNNVLFLSKLAQNNVEMAQNVIKWIGYHLEIFIDHEGFEDVAQILTANKQYQTKVLKLLKFADLSIEDFSIEANILNRKRPFDRMVETKVYHKGQNLEGNEELKSFDFSKEESNGTKQYFSLVFFLIDALEENKTLVLDEIDLRIHPVLLYHLIKLINKMDKNKQFQIIFTAHNQILLDFDLLRRDQIWFTEKDKHTGATKLFSLYDFDYTVRNDVAVQKWYLDGRYGAVPEIKEGFFYEQQ